ncbi:MAG: ATP-dependent DNA helicase [Alphaproteobacteria bacterium]|nr:ATP-dependent DNA helicase [Alphaproteobacteria bacterium]MBL6938251.1 ATP-dependent DNA helicase [Alphaproteobacteria bacterium]MBL7097307.1 ATP-dependent DNA helicase [Alphaproteobacteria bacterium]
MASEPTPSRSWRILPALVPSPGGAVVCENDGACRKVGLDEARRLFRSGNVLVAHAAFVSGRLKTPPAAALFDVLELFAFVRPGAPFIPSALGLARAMGLLIPHTAEQQAAALRDAAIALLDLVQHAPEDVRQHMRVLAMTMGRAGWKWAGAIIDRLGEPEGKLHPIAGMETWRGLPEWEDAAAPDKPGSLPVSADDARARLHSLVHRMGEMRPEQAEYTDAASFAFSARDAAGAPKVALVEAGTGVGKTLGYLAPASLWAEKNGPGLWISTYTRNLQRQIVQEIGHLYPDPDERAEKAVVRKGRENYLCLLNFEEAAKRTALAPGQRSVALGLIARWVGATPDGDVSGAGFPAFLGASIALSEVTDRRGECVYAACPHYKSCFIERAIRRARHAPIVVANHALVIAQASQDWLNIDETTDTPPEKRVRYVFDEGHHLFDAADSGFAPLLSGMEMTDLRRWVRGPEGGARSRMRGLQERLRDLLVDDREGEDILGEAINASGALSAAGWMSRLQGGGPRGPGELFLAAVYQHVKARSGDDADSFYTLEADVEPLGEELKATARDLARGLKRLSVPLMRLSAHLRKQLDQMSDELQSYSRARIDAAARALAWRGKYVVPTWIAMLDSLEGERDPQFVDWFEIAREDGRDKDVGLERHWVDPTVPLARDVLAPAHGALITSATLRDIVEGVDDWQSAEVRTGAGHLPEPPKRASFGSPFNYAKQARIFVVKDVNRRDVDQIAAAFRELFLASDGGALGLFTAVRLLRAVEQRIAGPLADVGINLYAQHVDKLDTGALIDLFRAEENACLLGTDALRDGVDVPGRSLRLAVFDKVPWPKPTILHRARRAKFGKGYDDLLTRFRLKQAFGRLVRGADDRGCFVILEPATPSRLLSAFPSEAPVKRCGLAEAIAEIRTFLA